MELIAILAVICGIPAAAVARLAGERKKLRALPAPAVGPNVSAASEAVDRMPAPPRVPTWDERMEAVGIRRARLWEAMGGYLWEIGRDSGVFAEHARPEMIGMLFVIDQESAILHFQEMSAFDRERRAPQARGAADFWCGPCDRRRGEALYEIGKADVPAGTTGDGRPELRHLGVFCRACGAFAHGRAERSQALGALWGECMNMRRLIEALESPDAKRAIVQAKLACVEHELADVERRRGQLLAERAGLRAGLALGEPFRGLSLAALSDPPDDRAKAMPALSEPKTTP